MYVQATTTVTGPASSPPIINVNETQPIVDSYESKIETIMNLLNSSEESFTLTIRRRKIYLDTMQKLKIHWKENIKPFKVKFVGDSEEAEGSGVLREFLPCFLMMPETTSLLLVDQIITRSYTLPRR